ncbi:hypothetical protein CYLTODRAFT_127315 [Cylindrobasidium torrendii FP15055 ss-10]|uniref:F-box domain-containing protein n=1 Tax=Cylindrobasidium torrendii FP15055 ss-10 TaxID=1314674 RepID=A0A0D7B0I5_9AGAR|nr:hypothetical protein CYLTODRAFT_127315 [Cylindrobasidium torrendii FP15055 ss-10]
MPSLYVRWRRAFNKVMKRLPKKWGRKAKDSIPTTSSPTDIWPPTPSPHGYYVYYRGELDSSLEISETTSTTTGSDSATTDSDETTNSTESETKSAGEIEEIGELSVLKSVPLDILYEVLTHVEPLDLLQVARSSKRLRKNLLTRSARSIWLNSFDNVGFYRRNFVTLDHVSEPRLASVLFESICNNCGGKALFPPQCESCTSLCPRCLFNSGIDDLKDTYGAIQPELAEKLRAVRVIAPQLTSIMCDHHCHYPPQSKPVPLAGTLRSNLIIRCIF